MIHAVVSLTVGLVIYAAVVAFQSGATRADSEVWREFFGFSALCTLVLIGLLFWSAMGVGPGASGASIVDNLFNQRPARYFWMPYAGFAAAAFACCAALHVAALWVASRRGSASDA
jgi:hypothetical protein